MSKVEITRLEMIGIVEHAIYRVAKQMREEVGICLPDELKPEVLVNIKEDSVSVSISMGRQTVRDNVPTDVTGFASGTRRLVTDALVARASVYMNTPVYSRTRRKKK